MSQIEKRDEQEARLNVLRASETELIEGADAALISLGSAVDPITMRAKLGILLRAGRHLDAIEQVDQRLDPAWIDLYALALAFHGDLVRAQSAIDAADNCGDPRVMRQTRIAFAEGLIDRLHKDLTLDSLFSSRKFDDTAKESATTIMDILSPLLSLVRANNGAQTDLQISAITYALAAAHILNDKSSLDESFEWLSEYVPIPLVCAELSLRRLIQPPANLANRLRNEHPNNFQAAYLAALIDREVDGFPARAFDSLMSLSASANLTEEQKATLSSGLFETAGYCDSTRIQKAIDAISVLRPSDQRIIGLLRVFQKVDAGRLEDARTLLDQLRDNSDACWWQAHAQLCEKVGDSEAAQIAWETASNLLPHPNVIRHSVGASLDQKRYESAIVGLSKLLENDPDNTRDLEAMAWAMVQTGNYPGAVPYLERLILVDPTIREHRLPLAQCLARSARAAEASKVLQPLCESDSPPLDALLLQCELLTAIGKSRDAFQLLDGTAANYWSDPRFLLSYMHSAYAAGEDRFGHNAFAQLASLRQDNKVPDELMHEGTLEQLIEYGREYTARREALQKMIIGGRMPWLFAEEIIGNSPFWAWTLHTQQLRWTLEDLYSRASFSIYATNAFVVSQSKELQRVPIPERGVEVVADLTALITIYQLGRLKDVLAYFSVVRLPISYGTLHVSEGRGFGQHQPSRERELKRIRASIEQNRIRVSDEGLSSVRRLNEYSDDPAGTDIHIRDLFSPLENSQRFSQQELAELLRIAHRPTSGIDETDGVNLGAEIRVDLATLRVLATLTWFERLLEIIVVSITTEDQRELSGEIGAYESLALAKEQHDTFWAEIAEHVRARKVVWQQLPPADEGKVEIENHSSCLHSLQIASSDNKYLLIDDRVLQVLANSNTKVSAIKAFGSDTVLLGLLESAQLPISAVAEDFRKLISWRYKFLIPPANVMLQWAKESLTTLPGAALIEVAAYMHDCCRDPGLHCGFENTDPPTPLALRLVTTWIDTIATFLTEVWNDDDFTTANASRLTMWCGEEFLPAVPTGLWLHPIGYSLARLEAEMMLRIAMIKFVSIVDERRANLGLRVLAHSLCLDEDAYMSATLETINVIE